MREELEALYSSLQSGQLDSDSFVHEAMQILKQATAREEGKKPTNLRDLPSVRKALLL